MDQYENRNGVYSDQYGSLRDQRGPVATNMGLDDQYEPYRDQYGALGNDKARKYQYGTYRQIKVASKGQICVL